MRYIINIRNSLKQLIPCYQSRFHFGCILVPFNTRVDHINIYRIAVPKSSLTRKLTALDTLSPLTSQTVAAINLVIILDRLRRGVHKQVASHLFVKGRLSSYEASAYRESPQPNSILRANSQQVRDDGSILMSDRVESLLELFRRLEMKINDFKFCP